MCRLWGSEVSGWGCPTITGAPCWPAPTAPLSTPLPPPCQPFPVALPVPAAVLGPSPCRAKGASARGCCIRAEAAAASSGPGCYVQAAAHELLLSVCLWPRLCLSRTKTCYLVGAGPGLRQMPRRHWFLSRVSGASILESSESQGLLSNPLSAGTWRSSFPVLPMRVTSSEKSLSQMGSLFPLHSTRWDGLTSPFPFQETETQRG